MVVLCFSYLLFSLKYSLNIFGIINGLNKRLFVMKHSWVQKQCVSLISFLIFWAVFDCQSSFRL
jgi:hypothetical protein